MSPSQMIYLLMATALVTVLLQTVAGHETARFPQQAINLDSITDEELTCLLENSAADTPGRQCLGNPLIDNAVNGAGCSCVRWFQCPGTLVTRQRGGGTLGIVSTTRAHMCADPEDVCCNRPNTALNPLPPPPPTPSQQCGKRNPAGVGAVFTGLRNQQAQFGEFPWMAAIISPHRDISKNDNGYVAGGSLVTPHVVLTAAHVVIGKNTKQLLVRLGEWNFQQATEHIPHQDIPVNRIVFHPRYNHNTLDYDVALIYLARPAKIGPTVNTVCLPSPTDVFDGSKCISSGWGQDSFGSGGKYQQVLKSIHLNAVGHQQCQRALQRARHDPNFRLSHSFTCAGGMTNVDTCTGDGGSPLVCPHPRDPSTWIQAGIVAWGLGCGRTGIPGVYASIPAAVSWINEQLHFRRDFDTRLRN